MHLQPILASLTLAVRLASFLILPLQECTHLFLDLFSLQPWYRHYLMLGQPPANVRLFSVVLLRTVGTAVDCKCCIA